MTSNKSKKIRKNKKTKRKDTKIRVILFSCAIIIIILSSIYFYQKCKSANTFNNSSRYSIRGIDISHHNPILEWGEVKKQGINFAYLKATEGISHDDRNYPYNYKLASDNQIKIGSYHFYNFAISGREQAKHFIKVSQHKSGDLLPAIDVEHSAANPYSTDSIFKKNTIKELLILENELYEYYGHHPIIYTNLDCYKLYVKNNFPNNPIWISLLKNEPTDDIENWVIWQFSHKGKLDGIVGDIDFNYFRYSIDRMSEISLP